MVFRAKLGEIIPTTSPRKNRQNTRLRIPNAFFSESDVPAGCLSWNHRLNTWDPLNTTHHSLTYPRTQAPNACHKASLSRALWLDNDVDKMSLACSHLVATNTCPHCACTVLSPDLVQLRRQVFTKRLLWAWHILALSASVVASFRVVQGQSEFPLLSLLFVGTQTLLFVSTEPSQLRF